MFNSFVSILLLGYVTVPLPPGTYTEPVKPSVNQATEVVYRGSGRINPPNASSTSCNSGEVLFCTQTACWCVTYGEA